MDNFSLRSVLQAAGSKFSRSKGAAESTIAELELALGLPLPREYREFLLWSDGGELSAAGQAVDLWGVARILRRNAALSVRHYLPHVVLVGSNEGETALGYDVSELRPEPTPLAVPFGDLSPDAVVRIDGTLGSLVARVIDGAVDLDEICYGSS